MQIVIASLLGPAQRSRSGEDILTAAWLQVVEETIQVEPRRDSGHHNDGTWSDHGRHQGHPFQ
eukprot:9127541-Pyramimonas_sp.AAC.1